MESVQQLDDAHLRWEAKIGGITREWDAEIIRQEPNREVAWRATSGAENSGVVTFREVGVDRTEITLDLNFEPEGLAEQAGDKLGVVKSRAKGDLMRFKEFIESRPMPTGGWQGTIRDGRTTNCGRPAVEPAVDSQLTRPARWSRPVPTKGSAPAGFAGPGSGCRPDALGSTSHRTTMLAATGTVSHHAHSSPNTRRDTHHSPAPNATAKQRESGHREPDPPAQACGPLPAVGDPVVHGGRDQAHDRQQ